jgi:hypothetical protein
MSTPDREATSEYSRGSRPARGRAARDPQGGSGDLGTTARRLRIALLLAGFAGGVLLIAADFLTLFQIKVVTTVVKESTGADNHSYALVLLGATALLMAYGAARGSRPALLALAALGLVTAFVVLAIDLPDVRRTGVVGERYSDAAASARIGFYVETLGLALLLVSGVGGLLLTGERSRRPDAGPAGESAAARETRERDDAERERAAAERAARRGR